jgi:hypothetical protein
VADKGWQREFENPILLPDGRTLVTLRDAGNLCDRLAEKGSGTLRMAGREAGAEGEEMTKTPGEFEPPKLGSSDSPCRVIVIGR